VIEEKRKNQRERKWSESCENEKLQIEQAIAEKRREEKTERMNKIEKTARENSRRLAKRFNDVPIH
jgi:hypothetical protein